MSQELLDRVALHDLVMRYCRGCDRRDFALVRSLYHDDAVDDHGVMFKGGPDDFVAWLPSVTGQWSLTRHSLSNSLFVIDGDRGAIPCAPPVTTARLPMSRCITFIPRLADARPRR